MTLTQPVIKIIYFHMSWVVYNKSEIKIETAKYLPTVQIQFKISFLEEKECLIKELWVSQSSWLFQRPKSTDVYMLVDIPFIFLSITFVFNMFHVFALAYLTIGFLKLTLLFFHCCVHCTTAHVRRKYVII